MQWTREDDIRHGYYNAVNAQRLRAGLDGRGKVIAWHHRTAFTPIRSTFVAGADTPAADDLQQGVLDLALDVPNVRAEACKAPVHARIGWYRSVYNIFHAFAIGSFIDELAAARGHGPARHLARDHRPGSQARTSSDLGISKLPNYGESLARHPVDAGRLRQRDRAGHRAASWSNRKRAGRALGLAAHRSFVSYTAAVISVVPDKQRTFRIDEAWICMDAGTVVNQDRVHAQMESSVVMGISNAMYGGITMKGGAVEQSNFREARIARIGDVARAHPHRRRRQQRTRPAASASRACPPVGAGPGERRVRADRPAHPGDPARSRARPAPSGERLMKPVLLIALFAAAGPAPGEQRPSVAPKNMQNLTPALADYTDNVLFGDVWRRPGLALRDRSLVTVAVLVATGKTAQLPGHVGRAFDNGVRPQELAGLVTHLAFYAGWPSAVSSSGQPPT